MLSVSIYANTRVSDSVGEDQGFWIALFSLALIGIFALFLASYKIRKLQNIHDEISKKQKEIEKKQSSMLENMGEKIQDNARQNVYNESKLLDVPLEVIDTQEIKNRIVNLKNNDEELLRIAYTMIDFLKIKSGNIIIKQEAFQLSNMLHELTNAISPILKSKEHTLYYDIDNDVTRYLIGDTNRIYQILYNLMVDIMDRQKFGDVTLSIKIDEDECLLFILQNNTLYLSKEEIETLFIPSSWEEVQRKRKEFGFYVLNELIENMHGKFFVKSHESKGTQYALSIPYIRDLDNKSHKEELIKVLSLKKALVIDNDLYAAKILIGILHDFGIDVLFKSSENLKMHRPPLKDIDFIILKSSDISYKVLKFFKEFDKNKLPEIIVLHDIHEEDENLEKVSSIADAVLHSPLIVGDIEEVLKQLYVKKSKKEKDIRREKLEKFKIIKAPKVGIPDFQKFKDKTILIAEDNFVSQEVMSTILSASHLTIIKAENGKEVLDIVNDNQFNIDLIFMDMNMPVIDGFDVTREIRKNSKNSKVPIVAVTSLSFTYEIEEMLNAGIDACVIKPYRMGHIYMALERFLEPVAYASVNTDKAKEIKYQNKDILDIDKGLIYVRSEAFYHEIVVQILLALKNSDKLVASMIQKDQIDELRAFCLDALGLSATIGATAYVVLLKEMLMKMREEDAYLSQYIFQYKEKWLALEYEMKRYLRQ